MKVLYKNQIREAKRIEDCTEDEVKHSTNNYDGWNGNEIFIKPLSLLSEWIYVYDSEVKIIEE